MSHNRSKEVVQKLLAPAGITINGHHAYDMQVHNEKLYDRVLRDASLGLGEAYMDGWWDCEALDQFFDRILSAGLAGSITDWKLITTVLRAKLFNLQSTSRAFEVGEKHYDIGNELYEKMLDARLTYTCGYWLGYAEDARNLDQAQEAKLDLICRKLGLKPGMTVLDIGCGWGSFMKFAAEKYGVTCTGVTISKEQIALGEKLCAGLPITFLFQDYRESEW